MRVITLAGSPRYPSRSSALLEYARETLTAADIEVCHWHLQNFAPEDLLYARFDNPALQTLNEQLAGADGLIIATPVYKASFSGALKTLLDLLPERALEGKIVLPLATGGSQSHMLALDYALRPVLQALEARQVLTSIYATSQQLTWNDVSGLTLDQAIAWRVQDGVDALSAALNVLRQQADDVFVTQAQPVRLAR